MTQLTRRRVLAGTAAAAALVAGGLGALFAFTPKVRPPAATPGRPLLQNDEELFTDQQVGLQFAPPKFWSLQARSLDSPQEHRSERMVVKYKRLIPGLQVAWLKVSVGDAPGDKSPAEMLASRKLPEPDWKVTKPVEDGLTVAGRPAARVTFGGPLDPDHQGVRDFTNEVVAVRRGPQMFYFAGTYVTADPKGQKRIRTAIDTASLDPERFAPAH
jgi:hypothetical protein